MANNENDMGELLGHVLEDVQQEGIAGAGKKLLGGLLNNALGGALSAFTAGDGRDEDEDEENVAQEVDSDEDTSDSDSDSDDSDDNDPVVNTGGGNYLDTQVARKPDHDVDDDIDGDEDDTSAEQNLA